MCQNASGHGYLVSLIKFRASIENCIYCFLIDIGYAKRQIIIKVETNKPHI
jgi:hypothetical protein